MTRILGAIFFVFWMGLAMSQNIAGTWDVFDIAAIIFGFGALTVLIWDADFQFHIETDAGCVSGTSLDNTQSMKATV